MPVRPRPLPIILDALDAPTVALVRLAAAIAGGDEKAVRHAFTAALKAEVPPQWTEELVLQSYLFSGFPRALNAAREWRRHSPPDDARSAATELAAPPQEDSADPERVAEWRVRGEATCAAVYDGMYEKLRLNIRDLHPLLDEWMVVEGYGKVLGRPGLDLARRELCIVAACAASGQDRQLHSHLHGALNVGVSADALGATLAALATQLGAARGKSVRLLLARVVGK
jgi:4-carboxymuconolactone decarboxylase